MVRKVTEQDAAAIAGIYNYYVEKTILTFETEAVSTEEMRQRIAAIASDYPYYIYEMNGRVAGYCYASQWKKRSAYRWVVESAVYVDPGLRNKGIGRSLMTQLIEALRKTDIHAVIACISIPNPESIRLHESLGFEKVSHFREVGWKLDIRIDVSDWELLL
ncbi:MAG: GNAT family N-acetyltransferase [Tannerella sp.]|jgi:phosphinothricin acetyltransferase|nr:GNAT family N-acetyltransferase [Tannerella sp.]